MSASNDIGTEAAKAAPPIAVTAWSFMGHAINEWVAIATLGYLALQIFFKLRDVPGLKKPPSTSELIDWLSLLMADDMPEDVLRKRDPKSAIPPLYGALIKNEQDVQLLERLAFMTRR